MIRFGPNKVTPHSHDLPSPPNVKHSHKSAIHRTTAKVLGSTHSPGKLSTAKSTGRAATKENTSDAEDRANQLGSPKELFAEKQAECDMSEHQAETGTPNQG